VDPCPVAAAAPTPIPAPAVAAGPSGAAACTATSGFDSVGVRPAGGGARLELSPRTAAGTPTVSVFQQSSGRRVIGERLVARFNGAVNWDGRANQPGRSVPDGTYVVRFTLGDDTRRVALRRSGGRFTRLADYHRRASCDLLPSFKLSRPVFGGTGARPLGISYRVARRAQVFVNVMRGSRIVQSFPARTVAGGRTARLTLRARGLRRGDYRVRLVARDAASTLTSTLVSRRL
jgi:5-hydroxyisourate hydrolase-like protein (transthyretin family)